MVVIKGCYFAEMQVESCVLYRVASYSCLSHNITKNNMTIKSIIHKACMHSQTVDCNQMSESLSIKTLVMIFSYDS